MDPGKLNKRVTLVGATESENAIGQTVLHDGDIASMWASIEPVRGRQYYDAKKLRDEAAYKVTVRYRKGVTREMRIRFKDRTFEIKDIINPYESNQFLELMCAEKVQHGESV